MILLLSGGGCAGSKCAWSSVLRTESGVLLARRPVSRVSLDDGQTWTRTNAPPCAQLFGSSEDILCVAHEDGELRLWKAVPPYLDWEELSLTRAPYSAGVFRGKAVLTAPANSEGFLMWKVEQVLAGADSPRYIWHKSVNLDDWSLENEPAALSMPHGRSLETPWRADARQNKLTPLGQDDGVCFAAAERGVFVSHCEQTWERLGSFPSDSDPGHYFIAGKQLFIVSESNSCAYGYALGAEPVRIELPTNTRRLWLLEGELWASAPSGLYRDGKTRGSWSLVLSPARCTRTERRGRCAFIGDHASPPEMTWDEICSLDPAPCRERQ